MSALQRVIAAVGSQSGVARALGGKVRQGHVYYWLRHQVPAAQVLPLCRISGGVVTPHELRPDIYTDPDYRPSIPTAAVADLHSSAQQRAEAA